MRVTTKLIVWFSIMASVAVVLLFILKKEKNPLEVDVSKVNAPVEIRNFDWAFFTSDTLNWVPELEQLKTDFEPFFTSTDFAKYWYDMRTDPLQVSLFESWRKLRPRQDEINRDLIQAFKHLYYYYPNYPPIEAYTYISRLDFEYPVLHADNYLFIATDLFLGKNNPNYHVMPDYLRYFRQPEFMCTEVIESFAMRLNAKDNADNTLLNEMIWWGKNLYFTKAMLPNQHDSTIIRYSSKKLDFSIKNEQEMWKYIIDNALLFNTTDDARRRFVEVAPFTKFGMPTDSQTPGMLGRWIGWRIVDSYMKNNTETTLPELMADPDHKKIFKYSKYKP